MHVYTTIGTPASFVVTTQAFLPVGFIGYYDNSGSTIAWQITHAGDATFLSCTTSSDYRIKENVKSIDLSSYTVDHLKPIIYDHKDTKKTNIGFLAHEVQEYFPFLVSGVKDGPNTQSINYIGLIGVLTKEIQDLKKRVTILEKN